MLEGDALPFLARIVSYLQKKLKEGDSNMHEAISSSFGNMVHNTLHTIADLPESCHMLGTILKPLFINFRSGSKVVQMGSSIALISII